MAHEEMWGRMVSLKGERVTDVPVEEAVNQLKTLDLSLYKVAEVFFG